MDIHERIRWAGIAGLAGALLLMVGDQCFYFAAVSGTAFVRGFHSIVATQPVSHALFGATLGPFSALLYLVGFWHVYMQLRSRQPRLAVVVWFGLSLCILAGASYHVLWGAKLLTIQATSGAAPAVQPALAALEAKVRHFAANIYLIAEVAGYPSLLLLAILVATGRTHYPRWLVLLTPAIPLMCLQFIGPHAPSPFGSLLNGSASNLSFALFFAASLAITWNRKTPFAAHVAA